MSFKYQLKVSCDIIFLSIKTLQTRITRPQSNSTTVSEAEADILFLLVQASHWKYQKDHDYCIYSADLMVIMLLKQY